MTPIKVHLTFIRSTKNYHVYEAELDAPVIPDKLYIRQDALGPDAPVQLTLTVSTDAAWADGSDALDAAYARGVGAGREAGYLSATEDAARDRTSAD